jgi:hypothetical protein
MNMSYTSNETSDDDVFLCEHCEEYYPCGDAMMVNILRRHIEICGDTMIVNALRRHTEIWCKDCANKHASQLTISPISR